MTTVTTALPSHSKSSKDASALIISTSKLRVDTSSLVPTKFPPTISWPTNSVQINTHTPNSFPIFAVGITSTEPALQTNSLQTGTSEALIFSSTFPPITIEDTSHTPVSSSEHTSTESFPPKALPTTNSIAAGASTSTASSLNSSISSPLATSSPDVTSDQTSSSTGFLPSNLRTSLPAIAFSSAASSILRTLQTKDSTPLSTPVTMLPTDLSATSTILTSTSEVTTTPVVPSSITPSSTGFSISTAIDRFLPTISHDSSPLINTLHKSSPTVHSSFVGMVTTRTVPTSASHPHTFNPLETLTPLDSSTTEQPPRTTTAHLSTTFVENAIQTDTSMPTNPLVLSPSTSDIKKGITTMAPNTESLTTTAFSLVTSSVLSDSPPLSTAEAPNETKVKPIAFTSPPGMYVPQ